MLSGNLLKKLWRRDFDWLFRYLLFLVKMGVKDPVLFLKEFLSWNVFVFLPGVTKRSVSAPVVLQTKDVEEAVRVFYREGFVVLSDALTPDEVEKLRAIVERKANDIVRMDREGLIPPESKHGHNRYSFGEYGHSPEWEYLAHNEKVLAIIKAIWKGHAFRAVGAGGDFVLPGGTWQPLHNDLYWKGAGERLPRVVTVNYYVSDVLPISGPIRQIPGTARFPIPNHVVAKFEPQWMKKCVVTGKSGYAIIRDSRAWHGGTPNTSTQPRYMPNLEYVLRDVSARELYGDVVLEQTNRGKWIAEFANS